MHINHRRNSPSGSIWTTFCLKKNNKPMTVGGYCREKKILNVKAWNDYAHACILDGVRYLDLDDFLNLELP